MGRFPQGRHSSAQFDDELNSIHSHLLEMGRLAMQQVQRATTALTTGDLTLASRVLFDEAQVDRLEKIIDEECALVLARRQPAAGDLRMLIAASKGVADLERVGDEAAKLASMAEDNVRSGTSVAPYTMLHQLSVPVLALLERSLEALSRFDLQLAVEVTVDRRYRDVLGELLAKWPKVADRGAMIDLIWALRSLERVGDHARNLSEQAIFCISGKDIRHLSRDQITDLLPGVSVP
ncbi:MAG: phosphate signaling complex protein PhoU [Polycyclovorans sp.]|nr:phosphate signaling complex protein PhoU [Polycyclovorans sp.]